MAAVMEQPSRSFSALAAADGPSTVISQLYLPSLADLINLPGADSPHLVPLDCQTMGE
jgi:hypothetical protein